MIRKKTLALQRLANALNKIKQRKQARKEAVSPFLEDITGKKNQAYYARTFKLRKSDFKGLVLDVGAGLGIPQEIQNSKIICLDPAYFLPQVAQETKKIKRRIAGIAQEMPFKEKTFKTVLAFYSVPYYLKHLPSEAMQSIIEMIRVSNKKIGFFPFDRLPTEMKEKITKSLKKARFGFKIQTVNFEGLAPMEGKQAILIYKTKNSNFQILKKSLSELKTTFSEII